MGVADVVSGLGLLAMGYLDTMAFVPVPAQDPAEPLDEDGADLFAAMSAAVASLPASWCSVSKHLLSSTASIMCLLDHGCCIQPKHSLWLHRLFEHTCLVFRPKLGL